MLSPSFTDQGFLSFTDLTFFSESFETLCINQMGGAFIVSHAFLPVQMVTLPVTKSKQKQRVFYFCETFTTKSGRFVSHDTMIFRLMQVHQLQVCLIKFANRTSLPRYNLVSSNLSSPNLSSPTTFRPI